MLEHPDISKGRDVRSIRSQMSEGETAGMGLDLNNAEFDAIIDALSFRVERAELASS